MRTGSSWIVLLSSFLAVLSLTVSAKAKSRVMENFPYVTSMGGVFYARAIPDDEQGADGTTTIYRVRRKQDEIVQRHDWYASGGLHLGWSPIAGKVAALAIHDEPAKDPREQVQLRCYLGPEHLATYTTWDLMELGAKPAPEMEREGPPRAQIRIVGCEQIPRTNEYVFRIVLQTARGEKTIDLDVLTGKPYDPAQAATRPAHD